MILDKCIQIKLENKKKLHFFYLRQNGQTLFFLFFGSKVFLLAKKSAKNKAPRATWGFIFGREDVGYSLG